jgi:hypothetical protein
VTAIGERVNHVTWEHELDAMEACLDAHREAFSYRKVTLPPPRRPSAPEELGPLPDELRPRAERLLRATQAFEGEVADARASVVRALRHAGRAQWARAS